MSCVIRPKNFDFHSSIFTFFIHARQLKECYQDFYDSVTILALLHDPIRLNQLDWVALTLSMNEQEQNNAIYILIRFKDFAILEICICVRIMLLRAHCGRMEKLNLSHRLAYLLILRKDWISLYIMMSRLDWEHHQKTIVRHFSADSNAVFRCYDGAIKTHKTRTAACNPQSIHRDVDWRKEDKFHVFARDTDRKKSRQRCDQIFSLIHFIFSAWRARCRVSLNVLTKSLSLLIQVWQFLTLACTMRLNKTTRIQHW